MSKMWGRCALLAVLIAATATMARAQDRPPDRLPDEDIEPRVVGKAGATLVGVSGFVDRFYSSEKLMPFNYTAQVDVEHFVTRRLAFRLGVNGSGQMGGGEDSDALATGPDAPSLHLFAGALFYFTPRSMFSPYLATEYWTQVTQRGDNDASSAVGKAGLQAALSSRASLFVEAGMGVGLRRGSEGETLTRVVGQIGVRIKVR